MSNYLDLSGQRFGRLTVLRYAGYNNGVKWLCQCDCGKTKEIRSDHLRYGKSTSCGCYRSDMIRKNKRVKHGMVGTRLHNIWTGMKQRCSEKCPEHDYEIYYARGIRVCQEWKDSFEKFMEWALANGYTEEKTIDRIDTDGNYEPSNCRWVTVTEQNRNRRNTWMVEYNGEKKSLGEWAEELGIKYATLASRLRRGKSVEDAFKRE